MRPLPAFGDYCVFSAAQVGTMENALVADRVTGGKDIDHMSGPTRWDQNGSRGWVRVSGFL